MEASEVYTPLLLYSSIVLVSETLIYKSNTLMSTCSGGDHRTLAGV